MSSFQKLVLLIVALVILQGGIVLIGNGGKACNVDELKSSWLGTLVKPNTLDLATLAGVQLDQDGTSGIWVLPGALSPGREHRLSIPAVGYFGATMRIVEVAPLEASRVQVVYTPAMDEDSRPIDEQARTQADSPTPTQPMKLIILKRGGSITVTTQDKGEIRMRFTAKP